LLVEGQFAVAIDSFWIQKRVFLSGEEGLTDRSEYTNIPTSLRLILMEFQPEVK
jgi:hypothetical protein